MLICSLLCIVYDDLCIWIHVQHCQFYVLLHCGAKLATFLLGVFLYGCKKVWFIIYSQDYLQISTFNYSIHFKENEPVHEKTNNLGFRPGPTQTSLYSHRRNPES